MKYTVVCRDGVYAVRRPDGRVSVLPDEASANVMATRLNDGHWPESVFLWLL